MAIENYTVEYYYSFSIKGERAIKKLMYDYAIDYLESVTYPLYSAEANAIIENLKNDYLSMPIKEDVFTQENAAEILDDSEVLDWRTYTGGTECSKFLEFLSELKIKKVYELVVLCSFIVNNKLKEKVTEKELLRTWTDFFELGNNWIDIAQYYRAYLELTEDEQLRLIKEFAVERLLRAGSQYFCLSDTGELSFTEELKTHLDNKDFVEQMKNIIEYRMKVYYRQQHYRDVKFENRVLRVYVSRTTSTVDIIDRFEGYGTDEERYDRLRLSNFKILRVNGSKRTMSLVIERSRGQEYCGDVTFTQLKTKGSRLLDELIYTAQKTEQFKQCLVTGEMYRFDTPHLLRAQSSNERSGFDWEREYGETNHYLIIGFYT